MIGCLSYTDLHKIPTLHTYRDGVGDGAARRPFSKVYAHTLYSSLASAVDKNVRVQCWRPYILDICSKYPRRRNGLGGNVRMYALQRTAQVFSYAEHGVVAQLAMIITEMRN